MNPFRSEIKQILNYNGIFTQKDLDEKYYLLSPAIKMRIENLALQSQIYERS